jgi:hypothetical protein
MRGVVVMGKTIPFLSTRSINKIEDYQPFYHSKAYLNKKAGSLAYFKNQVPKIRKLAKKVGYKDFNQFIKHRKLWHDFSKKIPISYLEEIGVDLDVLKFTIELDQNDYQKALEIPLYPKSYTIQTRPLPFSKPLPENISEAEAVELVRREVIIENKSCVIDYPYLKLIFIDTDGSVSTVYYQPEIKIKRGYVIPGKLNNSIGEVSL